ncbi:MAG: NADH-quinone oxidoreductase subunit J [Xanthomonadaceae bacterium]|nr:NADH-quinone oxidoreductase subunit J [Xanthomonadaceae bacterium]
MSVESVLFYLFGTILVASALGVITARNPVHGVLLLVLAFFTAAVLWLLLQAEFLAIVLVLVYVGAVMVLFLFVVMMLDVNVARIREGYAKYLPLGIVIALVMAAQIVIVVGAQAFGLEFFPRPEALPADHSNTRALGLLLYTHYVYPFELAAVILLVAIVAAITLTLRHREGTRTQDVSRQVRVKRADRVRLVKMDSDKGEQP